MRCISLLLISSSLAFCSSVSVTVSYPGPGSPAYFSDPTYVSVAVNGKIGGEIGGADGNTRLTTYNNSGHDVINFEADSSELLRGYKPGIYLSVDDRGLVDIPSNWGNFTLNSNSSYIDGPYFSTTINANDLDIDRCKQYTGTIYDYSCTVQHSIGEHSRLTINLFTAFDGDGPTLQESGFSVTLGALTQ